MKCSECGKEFEPVDDEEEICGPCQLLEAAETAPELLGGAAGPDPDWCRACDCPIGTGSCGGCDAAACVMMDEPPDPETV